MVHRWTLGLQLKTTSSKGKILSHFTWCVRRLGTRKYEKVATIYLLTLPKDESFTSFIFTGAKQPQRMTINTRSAMREGRSKKRARRKRKDLEERKGDERRRERGLGER